MIFKLQSLVWISMVALLASNVLAEESNIKVSYCGSDDDILSIQELSFEPEFIQPGDDVMIYGSGSLSKDISLGTKVQVVLKYGGTDYYSTTIDYCSFVQKKEIDGDLQCPVHEGDLEVAQKVTIPKNIAKGVYTLHLQGTTDDGEPIGCADLQATF
ncbi:MD-2-related lipid-recognition domain-containing protein [Parasitella parasitica]|nr:MD-2-related lipid-recognition domain-containing protein [Parasitella parasitica]